MPRALPADEVLNSQEIDKEIALLKERIGNLTGSLKPADEDDLRACQEILVRMENLKEKGEKVQEGLLAGEGFERNHGQPWRSA